MSSIVKATNYHIDRIGCLVDKVYFPHWPMREVIEVQLQTMHIISDLASASVD